MSDASVSTSGPRRTREAALAIVRRLRDAGHVAYFAGGCVRDALLGLEPKDYDVATDAPPARVRELFRRTQAVGAAFGVILVREGFSQIEVATFRAEGEYLDGRHPEHVRFTTAEEDANRRDFTINGMFYDPIDDRVIDFVGGQQDLQNRCLRTIGDPSQRFAEDHLRMLRAVRFSARFDLEIKSETATAITTHRDQLKRISPERIADELRAMLEPPTRQRAWQELWRLGLMPVLFRQMPEQAEKMSLPQSMLFPMVAPTEHIPFGLVLAATALCYRVQAGAEPEHLLENGEVNRTNLICRTTFKISNDESEMLTACTELGPLLREQPPTVAFMKRFLAKPFANEARQMLDAIGQAWPRYAERVAWLNDQFEEFLKSNVSPTPFVTGNDLTAAGLTPGKAFKIALDTAYDAQLESRVTTKEQALELAIRIAADNDFND